jgi:hypothetical protein
MTALEDAIRTALTHTAADKYKTEHPALLAEMGPHAIDWTGKAHVFLSTCAMCRHDTKALTRAIAEAVRNTPTGIGTDRVPLDKMTSDHLDALYARLDTLQHVAAGNKRHVELIVPDLERAEATIDRVRAAVYIADDIVVTDWQRGYRACAQNALTALDQPQQNAPVAQHASGNAEDCGTCRGADLPYPFLCPGTVEQQPTT